MPRFTIEDRIFTQLVIDSVTDVTSRFVPKHTAGTERIDHLAFALHVEKALREKLQEWLAANASDQSSH